MLVLKLATVPSCKMTELEAEIVSFLYFRNETRTVTAPFFLFVFLPVMDKRKMYFNKKKI